VAGLASALGTSPAQAARALSQASWRGLPLPPYSKVPLDWEPRLPKREYPYVDIAGHDFTGVDYKPFEVDLRFLNTLNQAPPNGASSWFPGYWEIFKAQILDGKPGDFVHPLVGSVRARVCKGAALVSDETLAGIVVRVSWELTNEDPTTDQYFEILQGNPSALASAADASAGEFGVAVGLGQRTAYQFAAQYGTNASLGLPSLSSIWSAISGLVFSFDFGVLSLLNALLGDVDAMVEAIILLDDVTTWEALADLFAFRTYLSLATTSVQASNRKVAQRAITAPITLDAFARQTNNDLGDIIALNCQFVADPQVPARSILRYYAS
jgi:hypothetical protein